MTNRLKILAIDPGGTVGFSSSIHKEPFWQIKFEDMEQFYTYLLGFSNFDVMIFERFDHRQKTNIEQDAIEQIGVIKLFSCKHPDIKLVAQGADCKSEKGFWDNKKLKHLGLYQPRKLNNKHGLDALRHRLHYEERNGMFDYNLLKDLA